MRRMRSSEVELVLLELREEKRQGTEKVTWFVSAKDGRDLITAVYHQCID